MTKLGILLTDNNHSGGPTRGDLKLWNTTLVSGFPAFLFPPIYFFAIAKAWHSKFDWAQLSNSLSCILSSADLQDLDDLRT